MFADLHMHSTFSDGNCSPEKLVDENYSAGVRVMALTDHDCIDGITEALKAAEKYAGELKIIPGIELSTEAEHRPVHILGYYIDTKYQPMLDILDWLRDSRDNRVHLILDKLHALGYHLKPEDIVTRGKAIGRPHVAKALVHAGYFEGVQEAFDTLLHFGGPAYVPHAKLSPKEAVDLIHAAGGLAVLAHPSEIENDALALSLLDTLSFDGVEVYHPSALEEERQEILREWAKEKNLLITGGTDFHGTMDRFPNKIGLWLVDLEKIKEFLAWK